MVAMPVVWALVDALVMAMLVVGTRVVATLVVATPVVCGTLVR